MLKIAVTDWRLYYITIMLIISSICSQYLKFSVYETLFIIVIGLCLGFIFAIIINLFRNRVYRNVMFGIIAVMINVLFIVDLFLVFKFDKIFDDDIYFVITNTTNNEATGFLSTTIDFMVVLKIVAIIVVSNFFALWVTRKLPFNKRGFRILSYSSFICSFIILGIGIIATLKSLNPVTISRCNILTNYAHPILTKDSGYYETLSISKHCRDLSGKVSCNPNDSTVYVVVIGESHSKYHNGIYGYSIPTDPNIKSRYDNGEIIVYDNCQAYYRVTHKAMKSIYSFSRSLSQMNDYPIFPAVFHAAGYHTELYDNQFLPDCPRHVVNDPETSTVSYDFRNNRLYDYDHEIIDAMHTPIPHSLIVINLNGHHMKYSDRIPDDFPKTFTSDDYAGRKVYSIDLVRDYDNCNVYFDYVMETLMSKFDGMKCCLIYFSDHGESLGEDGFVGHGQGSASDINSRTPVPFFIWGSPSFRASEAWQRLAQASNQLITTDDVSHLLVDLASIEYDGFDPSRSFINKKYDYSQIIGNIR